jgi:hypothetical protein
VVVRVLVFNHMLRGLDQPREPVMRVHNDYTERSAPQRVRDLTVDEAEALLAQHYVFINVGRPIGHTVIDTPLALCAATSFTDDDLIITDLVYKNRVGEIASVRHDPRHRWVFFSRMRPDEVVLIKCHDTTRRATGERAFPSTPRSRIPPRRQTQRPARASKSAPSPFSKTDRVAQTVGGR